jgi:ankyrin repeat protein
MRNDTELVGRMLEAWPKAAQWRQNPLHPKGEHMTALIHAARWGHKEMTELLIAHGAPIDAQDNNAISALAHAVRLGRKEVVKVLLEQGANPSALTKPYIIGQKPERFDILDMLKDALDAANSKPRTEQEAKPASAVKGKAPKK